MEREEEEEEEGFALAIAYMDVSIITRGQGDSVVRSSAYRSAEEIYCEYTNQTYCYPRKHDEVVYSEIILPAYAPERLRDRAVLWNEVEWIEPKSNSQLAREIKIALPRELSQEQNIALARDFAQALVDRGMVADLCIHDRGTGNPHAHIMLTMRPFTEKGTWGMKSREVFLLDEHGERILLSSGRYKSFKVCTTNWNTKEALLEWRKLYQDITNEHLARAGVDARISTLSYAEQGIERESMVHLGPFAHRMELRGEPTYLGDLNRDIQARNALRDIFASKFAEWVQSAKESLKAEVARLETERRQALIERFICLTSKTREKLNFLQDRLEKVGKEQLAQGVQAVMQKAPLTAEALHLKFDTLVQEAYKTLQADTLLPHEMEMHLVSQVRQRQTGEKVVHPDTLQLLATLKKESYSYPSPHTAQVEHTLENRAALLSAICEKVAATAPQREIQRQGVASERGKGKEQTEQQPVYVEKERVQQDTPPELTQETYHRANGWLIKTGKNWQSKRKQLKKQKVSAQNHKQQEQKQKQVKLREQHQSTPVMRAQERRTPAQRQEMLQQTSTAYPHTPNKRETIPEPTIQPSRRNPRARFQPNGWPIKTGKDWQSKRLRKQLEQAQHIPVLTRFQEPAYEPEPVSPVQPHPASLLEPKYTGEPQPHHGRTRKSEERSSHYAENVRMVRSVRTRYDERNQRLREGNYSPEQAFDPWQKEVLERSFNVEEEKSQLPYIKALLYSKEFASWLEATVSHHERTRRNEVRSQHYAENVRTIRRVRTRYNERNQELRDGKQMPERAFEPWQEKLLERSFQVEEEKAQPASINALLHAQRIALRSSEVEPQPHHERLRRDAERSQQYAENICTIHEKRKHYDERNRSIRTEKWTPERAFEPWQEKLLEHSFQIEEEKGQPASIQALLLTKETAPRSLEVEPQPYHEQTSRDEVRSSSHYAENARIVRSVRTRYDERNQGLREGSYSPERAFEPWQEKLLEQSFQVEEKKAQPAYLNALLHSKGVAPRWSQELAYHHERTWKDTERSSHYAENVRMVRRVRTRYDERNQERREGNYVPEQAFEPWQREVLERSFQVEEEKGQSSYVNALLFATTQTKVEAPHLHHHERTWKDTERSSHYAENIRIVRSIRTRYGERNLERREGNYSPGQAFEPWQQEVLERSFQGEYEKGQPAYIHALLLSKETTGRASEVQFGPEYAVEPPPHHERTGRDTERSSHYAETVWMVREERTRYDKHNQELRQGKQMPGRAFEPWQQEVLERSFQIEYEKEQPAFIHALLLSRETMVRASEVQFMPKYPGEPQPHHERTRRDEARSQHYAETVRIVRDKRKRYDKHNQEKREGKSASERAFEPGLEEVLTRSFQVEEQKVQPAAIHALLLAQGTAPQAKVMQQQPLQHEQAAGDRPEIVPEKGKRHHWRSRGKEASEHEMHTHLHVYLTMVRTARKALLHLQHRLTQIWQQQLAPLLKEVSKAQALHDSFNKLEKIRALQAILLARIQQKVREAEEHERAEASLRETLLHHIPPSIQRAIRDLEPRKANKQQSAVHLLETERRPPPDEPLTTHVRPEKSHLVKKGQAKGHSP